MNSFCGRGIRLRRLSHLHEIFWYETRSLTTLTPHTTTTKIPYRSCSNKKGNMADSKWTAPLVRKQFLDFFKEKGHTIGM